MSEMKMSNKFIHNTRKLIQGKEKVEQTLKHLKYIVHWHWLSCCIYTSTAASHIFSNDSRKKRARFLFSWADCFEYADT